MYLIQKGKNQIRLSFVNAWIMIINFGAGDENRTHVSSLED